MSIRTTVFVLALATPGLAFATDQVGSFEGASDVGDPALKGSATFDSERNEYRVTGGGENVWNKRDEFQFVWRKLSGNMSLAATLTFEGTGGVPHRKAGLMIRRGLEPDAPYVDAVVHGDGLTNIQWRETAGDITRGVRFPMLAPGRIRLERRGNVISLWTSTDGQQPLLEAGSIALPLGKEPLYVGLFVCSHDPKAVETAVFSGVAVETLP
jgi:hypothetical protein